MRITATQLRQTIRSEISRMLRESTASRASYDEAHELYSTFLDKKAEELGWDNIFDHVGDFYDEVEREASAALAPLGWTPEQVRNETFGLKDHERPDEARSQLSLGMKKWLKNPEAGWTMITSALKSLMDLEDLSDDDVMDEVTMAADTAGFGDDDVLDIDSSIRDWLESGGM